MGELPLPVCRLVGVWTEFRPKIISCLEPWSRSSGGGKYARNIGHVEMRRSRWGFTTRPPYSRANNLIIFFIFFPELQGNQSARTTDCEKFTDRDSSPQKGTSTPFSTYHYVERSSGDMIGGEELFHLKKKSAKITHELRQKSSPAQESVRLAGQLDMDTMSFHQKHPQPSGTGATFMCPVPVA